MNKIWVNRLIAGTQTWNNVPTSRKNAIKEILRQYVKENKITEDKYNEIVNE